ncbi:diaminobutyrate acetyltransferase [Streptomyces rochei]|uniref:L-2,4-diaminobutyric acid acetyltransferase n=1 Tax=Streptomyces vinaceusdrappus TaxID=67376 RepID=A0ABY6C4F9_9ACTN|nr:MULTISPECIES: diaminobutyrate acetyltransferase [Streptomyces]NUV96908.1 diaminobutyrate acetyltransferase [Streptomyces sp. KAI 90]RSS23540.1 diaminobutyrate acetyltransferase [Streptomyces sp. WAC08452]UXI82826.1 diaminobutyrate acetyltransferase [Streptomyces vinaceusdrappus]
MTAPASPTTASRVRPEYRTPRVEDAQAMWQMVHESDELDDNSPYYYALWCRDFADTSLVAELENEVIGFLTGYFRPEQPDTYLVWQEAAKPRHGIPMLGVHLFERAADRAVRNGARYIEATVSADNKAIIMVLKKCAKRFRASVHTEVLFPASLFPEDHHDEVLYRIGPIEPATG